MASTVHKESAIGSVFPVTLRRRALALNSLSSSSSEALGREVRRTAPRGESSAEECLKKRFSCFLISVYHLLFSHLRSLSFVCMCTRACACRADAEHMCRGMQMKEFPTRNNSKSVCLTNLQHMLDSMCVCTSLLIT